MDAVSELCSKNCAMKQRYAKLTLDTSFKRAFKNKGTLKLFLEMLIPSLRVKKLRFTSTEHLSPFKDGKNSRIDIEATDSEGRHYDIEMQLANQPDFMKRMFYYSSFLVQEQITVGRSYNFRPVYIIIISAFTPDWDDEMLLHEYTIMNTKTGRTMLEDMRYLVLDLTQALDSPDENSSELDKLAYTILNMHNFHSKPDFLKGQIYDNLFKSAEMSMFEPDRLKQYLKDNMLEFDRQEQLRYAVEKATEEGMEKGMEEGMKKGRKEGMKEGMEKGMKKGMKEGMEKGMEKGAAQEKNAIARAMMEEGIPTGTIARITGLSEEQLAAL